MKVFKSLKAENSQILLVWVSCDKRAADGLEETRVELLSPLLSFSSSTMPPARTCRQTGRHTDTQKGRQTDRWPAALNNYYIGQNLSFISTFGKPPSEYFIHPIFNPCVCVCGLSKAEVQDWITALIKTHLSWLYHRANLCFVYTLNVQSCCTRCTVFSLSPRGVNH